MNLAIVYPTASIPIPMTSTYGTAGRAAHRPDFAKADPRDRDHDHEEGVKRFPAEHHVADHPQPEHRQDRREPHQRIAPHRAAAPQARRVGTGAVGHRRRSDREGEPR